jgi:hypothetical protein
MPAAEKDANVMRFHHTAIARLSGVMAAGRSPKHHAAKNSSQIR